MRAPLLALAALALAAGCKKTEPAVAAPAPAAVAAPPSPAPLPPREHGHGHAPLSLCETRDESPLEAARAWYDEGEYEKALSCAARASALAPSRAEAHAERATALTALGRYEEAKLAWARTLALDPDGLEGLAGAAHLYTVALPGGREHDELGMLYAERGLHLAASQGDAERVQRFGVLSAMAANDLGLASQALSYAEGVLSAAPADPEAAWERALALFELCRFGEAKAAFEARLGDPEQAAHAHQHLGQVLERKGRQAEAEAHFATARKLHPQDFPPPVVASPERFQALLDGALAGLPEDMKRDLQGVPVTAEDLPSDADLLVNDPPLSPTILGIFRGPPLGEPCVPESPGMPCRSISLYRLNLLRAVGTQEELAEQVRTTLVHELGHLRGEDDSELAARGLE
ncbi:MAG: metallopeptidase family protein [Deltaproteobacteria bacterium]|nr:metallopeptidase family protein [Deltaproteobacteria bacterium]